MKLNITLSLVATVVFSCYALADNYSELVARGYRWINVNGPYACHSETNAQRITGRHADATDPNVVQNIWCYYLIPGRIVQVVMEDRADGMSQMRVPVVPGLLWTNSKFLSRRPVRDPYGLIDTPESPSRESAIATGAAVPIDSTSPKARARR